MKVLVATSNAGKIREIREILGGASLSIVTPAEVGVSCEVVEDGQTFEENALKKARAWVQAAGLPALADDSGLCVEALGGEPGVHSARWAGPQATDADNCRLLLKRLHGVAKRSARFVCVMALVLPDGRELVASGTCHGHITEQPRGENGFGYDPVFLDPVTGRTFAQLSPQEKNARSHRRQALKALQQMIHEAFPKGTSG